MSCWKDFGEGETTEAISLSWGGSKTPLSARSVPSTLVATFLSQCAGQPLTPPLG